MNVNDSDIVRSILLDAGYSEAVDEATADIWLTNTCAIRDKAEQKVWQRLHILKKQKKVVVAAAAGTSTSSRQRSNSSTLPQSQQQDRREPVVGLLGCMAERLQEDLFREQMVDLVVGPDAYRDLPRLLRGLTVSPTNGASTATTTTTTTDALHQDARPLDKEYDDGEVDELFDNEPLTQAINVQLSMEETYADIFPTRRVSPPTTTTTTTTNAAAATATTVMTPFNQSAFVSIQRGCSNRCSFCIVPFTRGQERSRAFDSILGEIQQLIDQDNIKEVVLLGQNVKYV
jgi:tRNA A37 methylthiotransferase MiaB